jgi:hypothetical protein
MAASFARLEPAKLRRDRPFRHRTPGVWALNTACLLEGIARGEKAIEEGRTVSHTQAKKRLARWLE